MNGRGLLPCALFFILKVGVISISFYVKFVYKTFKFSCEKYSTDINYSIVYCFWKAISLPFMVF